MHLFLDLIIVIINYELDWALQCKDFRTCLALADFDCSQHRVQRNLWLGCIYAAFELEVIQLPNCFSRDLSGSSHLCNWGS